MQWGRPGFKLWVRKITWRKTWQPTPVFLPGESPWTEEPGGLQSIGSQVVGRDRLTKHTCDMCINMYIMIIHIIMYIIFRNLSTPDQNVSLRTET